MRRHLPRYPHLHLRWHLRQHVVSAFVLALPPELTSALTLARCVGSHKLVFALALPPALAPAGCVGNDTMAFALARAPAFRRDSATIEKQQLLFGGKFLIDHFQGKTKLD